MGTQYVQSSELGAYVNADAIADIADDQLTAACVAASSTFDSYARARVPLPLLSFGADIKLHVAWVAVYIALRARGYNPANEGETDPIRDQYNDAIAWMKEVERQAVTPDWTFSTPNAPNYSLPAVRTHQMRGW